jgi:glycosyltransferase involved in cell wall biosynthesis
MMTDKGGDNPIGSGSCSHVRGLRVLHLIDHMGAGGAQRVVLDLAESRSPGVEMSIASLRSHCLPVAASRMAGAGVVYRGLGLTRRKPFGIHKVRRWFKEWRPDVVHSHLEVSNTYAVIASLFPGDTRPCLINHLHNDPHHQYSIAHRLAGRLLVSRFDAHIVPSKPIAIAMEKAFGKRYRSMEIIPYGIDSMWLKKGPTPRTAGLRGGAKHVIGTVGRLVPQKSTRSLLQATPRLLAAEPSTRIIIVGDGPLMPELKAECKSLGIEETVSFLGFSDDLESIYSALDVFVLPSWYEGFPISLLEVMAMGTPVVATSVIGITDLVEDGKNGLLVPYDSPGDLGSAILRLLSDDSLRHALCENAREIVRHGHTRDVLAARVESLYSRLCSHASTEAKGVA